MHGKENSYEKPSVDIIRVLQARVCVRESKRWLEEVAKEPKSVSWIEIEVASEAWCLKSEILLSHKNHKFTIIKNTGIQQ